MKKKSLDKNPRPLSPAEQISAEILREIFSYLDLRKLSDVATVSKFWDEQTRQDSRWRELYVKEFYELYRLFNNRIPPNSIRKKYLEAKRIRSIIAQRVVRIETAQVKHAEEDIKKRADVEQFKRRILANKLTEKKENDFIKIFKNAVKKNALEVVHVLLKDNLLNIHLTFKYFGKNSRYECENSTLVYYAARKGSLDMVKLLLLHGADVAKEVTWSYLYSKMTMSHSYSTHNILNDLSILSHSLKSIVCIGYAEYFLFKNDFEAAIKYFEKSNNYNPKVISDYIQQVHQDKMGFKFNYDEDLVRKLNACYKDILDKDRASQKTCSIS